MLFAGNTAATYSSLLLPLKKKKIVKKEKQKQKLSAADVVKYECLEEANEISEPFGVWGGLNEVERKRESIYT